MTTTLKNCPKCRMIECICPKQIGKPTSINKDTIRAEKHKKGHCECEVCVQNEMAAEEQFQNLMKPKEIKCNCVCHGGNASGFPCQHCTPPSITSDSLEAVFAQLIDVEFPDTEMAKKEIMAILKKEKALSRMEGIEEGQKEGLEKMNNEINNSKVY